MRVTKECTFDAAHMLSDYNGLCANLHGHTYKVQLTLGGEKDIMTGMVLDFNNIKSLLDAVKRRFDHALIFSSPSYRNPAETELYEWASKYKMKYTEVRGRSTSETIAQEIKEQIRSEVDFQVDVRVWETPTSFCEV